MKLSSLWGLIFLFDVPFCTLTNFLQIKKVRLPYRAKRYDFHTDQKSTTSIQSKKFHRESYFVPFSRTFFLSVVFFSLSIVPFCFQSSFFLSVVFQLFLSDLHFLSQLYFSPLSRIFPPCRTTWNISKRSIQVLVVTFFWRLNFQS